MNYYSYAYRGRQDQLANMRAQGYEFQINADSYRVAFRGQFLHGATVMLPRDKPLHWKHRDANIRDNIDYALSIANQHRAKQAA